MSTIEINKFVGGFLMAMLLALGFNFIAQLLYGGTEHGREAEPVFVVEPAAPAAAQPAEPAAEEVAAEPAAEAAAPAEAATEPAPEQVAAAPAASAAGDIEAGAKVFKKCAACHSDSAGAGHKIGPNLWGVVGAPVAHHQDFKYSSALSGLGGTWDQARLDAFLADPKSYAPGTKMAFPGLSDAGDRAAVIAYLAGRGG